MHTLFHKIYRALKLCYSIIHTFIYLFYFIFSPLGSRFGREKKPTAFYFVVVASGDSCLVSVYVTVLFLELDMKNTQTSHKIGIAFLALHIKLLFGGAYGFFINRNVQQLSQNKYRLNTLASRLHNFSELPFELLSLNKEVDVRFRIQFRMNVSMMALEHSTWGYYRAITMSTSIHFCANIWRLSIVS